MSHLFKKVKAKDEVVGLTGEQAMVIYSYLKADCNETQCFTSHGISFSDSKVVRDDIEALESEILSKVSGTYITKEGVDSVYDEEGNETKESVAPEYFTVTSKTILKNSLSESILDAETVIDDLVIFYPPYNEKRTFDEFVKLFN